MASVPNTYPATSCEHWTIGLDVGSMAVKGALMCGDTWVARVLLPTGWEPASTGLTALQELRSHVGIPVSRVVSTGYGRAALLGTGSDATLTEISCHAVGAQWLFHNSKSASCNVNMCVRLILDIGGQDSKAIALDTGGNVSDFLMNDKCAAGTGRFLQNMAVMLGCTLEDFSNLPKDLEPHPISSMCTVFAETEVVGQLARGVSREALALGLLDSVASRAEGLLRRVSPGTVNTLAATDRLGAGAVAFTGGVSQSTNLVALLEKRLGLPVLVSPDSQFAGAIGAAILAQRQLHRLERVPRKH